MCIFFVEPSPAEHVQNSALWDWLLEHHSHISSSTGTLVQQEFRKGGGNRREPAQLWLRKCFSEEVIKEAVHEFDPLLFSTLRPEPLFQRGGSSQRILSCPVNASLETRPRTWGRFFVRPRNIGTQNSGIRTERLMPSAHHDSTSFVCS